MAVRKIKPATPGQRNKIISAFDNITKAVPEKSLLRPLRKSGGRNVNGKRTMRYIGGGHKQMYRVIDFLREKDGMQQSGQLSMIPTDHQELLSLFTKMEKKGI
jgi:large subunit ribosomal protein L2